MTSDLVLMLVLQQLKLQLILCPAEDRLTS